MALKKKINPLCRFIQRLIHGKPMTREEIKKIHDKVDREFGEMPNDRIAYDGNKLIITEENK